jgi:hypothetical protein
LIVAALALDHQASKSAATPRRTWPSLVPACPCRGICPRRSDFADIVEQLDEVLDDDDHVLGGLAVALALLACTLGRPGRCTRNCIACGALAALDHAELDLRAALEDG